jgi:hypothetical protein
MGIRITSRSRDGVWTVDLGGAHVYRVRVDMIDGVPRVLSLTVDPAYEDNGETLRGGRTPADVAITRQTLQAVPVQRIAAAVAAVREFRPADAFRRTRLLPDRPRIHDERHYRAVAEHAMHAKAAGQSARQAIATRWGVSLSTADLWIRRAKDYGLLRQDLRQPVEDR